MSAATATFTRACGYCPHTPAETCPDHGRKAKQKRYDTFRGLPSERGYDWRWKKHRDAFINKLTALNIPPVCGARLPGAARTTDSECAARGVISYGRTADHIIPVTGPDDPTFWVMEALQLLCAHCDGAKRQRESRGYRAQA